MPEYSKIIQNKNGVLTVMDWQDNMTSTIYNVKNT